MNIYCFAGPNGSGKSTIVNNFINENQLGNIPFVNADIIARNEKLAHIGDYFARNKFAADIAESLRNYYLENNQDFIFETVMSHPSKIEFLERAKIQGCNIHLVYVITQSPDINVARVAKRVSEGGHDVPEDKTRARYARCLELLPRVLEIADDAIIYDNSLDFQTMLSALKSKEGILYLYGNSEFIQNKIVTPYSEQSNAKTVYVGDIVDLQSRNIYKIEDFIPD